MVLVHEWMMRACLAADGQISDVAPRSRHHSILASYLLNSHRGQRAVLRMIMEDLCCFMELGAMQRATDLATVLKLFLVEHPDVGNACPHSENGPRTDSSFKCYESCCHLIHA